MKVLHVLTVYLWW